MKPIRMLVLLVALLAVGVLGVYGVTQARSTGGGASAVPDPEAAKVSAAPNPALQAGFDSGSDGANGPFPPGAVPDGATAMVLDLRDGVLTFQPGEETVAIPATPAGGFADGILRFTTFEVPEGVTLSFISNAGNTVVTILAQGDVNVLGSIDIGGEAGGPTGIGRGGFAGPGGFKGGNGQILNSSPEAGRGLGPGGGKGGGFGDADGLGGGGGGGFGGAGGPGQNANPNNRGGTYGTLALLPLVGGSGGGGGTGDAPVPGGGGGGGGGAGAILIASSTAIDISGSILAVGGTGGAGIQSQVASGGGGGSGGGIRLMAETLSGAGSLNASGGAGGGAGTNRKGGPGGLGRIRLEAVFFSYSGTATGVVNNGGLGVVFIPNLPTVRIVSVGGVAVPADPTGFIGGTDVIIASPGIATIELAATDVPVGTTISVTAKPETDADTIGPVISAGLDGTLESSTVSVDLDFPAGGVYFLEATATFTEPPP